MAPGSSSQLMTELVFHVEARAPACGSEKGKRRKAKQVWVWVKFRQIMVFLKCPHPDPWNL